jgi:hypothetical protein
LTELLAEQPPEARERLAPHAEALERALPTLEEAIRERPLRSTKGKPSAPALPDESERATA